MVSAPINKIANVNLASAVYIVYVTTQFLLASWLRSQESGFIHRSTRHSKNLCSCIRSIWKDSVRAGIIILKFQVVRKHFRVTRLVVKALPLLKTTSMLILKCMLCNNKEICKVVEILLRRNYLYCLSENATHPQWDSSTYKEWV
jgi:hypothetical protein